MTEKDKRIIEDSETNGTPIFVFTAKDKISVEVLLAYEQACYHNGCPKAHCDGLIDRITEFENWQKANPSKTKLPD